MSTGDAKAQPSEHHCQGTVPPTRREKVIPESSPAAEAATRPDPVSSKNPNAIQDIMDRGTLTNSLPEHGQGRGRFEDSMQEDRQGRAQSRDSKQQKNELRLTSSPVPTVLPRADSNNLKDGGLQRLQRNDTLRVAGDQQSSRESLSQDDLSSSAADGSTAPTSDPGPSLTQNQWSPGTHDKGVAPAARNDPNPSLEQSLSTGIQALAAPVPTTSSPHTANSSILVAGQTANSPVVPQLKSVKLASADRLHNTESSNTQHARSTTPKVPILPTISQLISKLRRRTREEYRDSFGDKSEFPRGNSFSPLHLNQWTPKGRVLEIWSNREGGLHSQLLNSLHETDRGLNLPHRLPSSTLLCLINGTDDAHATPTILVEAKDKRLQKDIVKIIGKNRETNQVLILHTCFIKRLLIRPSN